MKRTLIALMALSATLGAFGLTITLDKVKLQYLSEAERQVTLLDQNEMVVVTNDYRVWIGDGVTTGGIPVTVDITTNVLAGATNAGQYAVALGLNANASDAAGYGAALGGASTASGNSAVAVGSSSVASGSASFAVFGTASSPNTISIGPLSSATSGGTVSIGYDADATALNSIAIGYQAKAPGILATQIGAGTNSGTGTLQFGSYQLVGTGGHIPAARMTSNLDAVYSPYGLVTKTTATSYTVGTTSAKEAYGGIVYVTGAATITAPAVASGMHFTVVVLGAYSVSVDVNASDLMWLDGVTLDDGDKATSGGTSGETITLTYLDATGWVATSDGWSDGGP